MKVTYYRVVRGSQKIRVKSVNNGYKVYGEADQRADFYATERKCEWFMKTAFVICEFLSKSYKSVTHYVGKLNYGGCEIKRRRRFAIISRRIADKLHD